MKFEKIKLNIDFRRTYSRGISFVSPYIVTYIWKCKPDKVKLGITVSKKIGNAVCRNRAKRVIRAAFREVLPEIESGINVVVVARTRILGVKSTVVAEHLREHLNKSGVLK